MLPELGHFALILALCFAALQCALPLIGKLRQQQLLTNYAKPLALGQVIFVFMSFLFLMYAFIANDFSVAYVAEHSSRELPIFYRCAAVWGAHEGSMLLWASILALWTLAVTVFARKLDKNYIALVLAVLGFISFCFLLFIVATSNPFIRLLPHIPTNGRDLNPLLQDPGVIFHPPMLYMGYVGFAVTFAFAVAALIDGKLQREWLSWVRPWTLLSWCCLTLGITLGSWWAYRELGWGGWWFWDPVENASFLPWLVGTALLHSIIVSQKRGVFKAWTVLLAIMTFSLSLLGTFLVRSGILTSVHAFAVDPTRGVFMLMILGLVVGISLVLYALRSTVLRSDNRVALGSRESFILANNILLTVAMLTVLLGTLYPLIIDALGFGKLSVGAPYFNAVFVPIMTPLLLLMSVGPHAAWSKMRGQDLMRHMALSFCVALVLAGILPLLITGRLPLPVALGCFVSIWIMLATAQHVWHSRKLQGKAQRTTRWGMVLAHFGIAVTVLGITLSSHYSIQRDVSLAPGDSLQVADLQVKFVDIGNIKGSNYHGVAGEFTLTKVNQAGKAVGEPHMLIPQKRIYDRAGSAMTDAAIAVSAWRDVYIAMGEPIGNQAAWGVRIYVKPFVRWIWVGGFLMLFGGLLSVWQLRKTKSTKAKTKSIASENLRQEHCV